MQRVKINHGAFCCNLNISNYGDAITLKNDIIKQLNLDRDLIIEGFLDENEEILTIE
jgi:hypothetical protein